MKEQEDFKARHGMVAQKVKRTKSIYVEQPPAVHSNDDDDDDAEKIGSPKQRKRKMLSASETSDDVPPTKQITIPPKSPTKSPIKSPIKSSAIDQIASNDSDDEINKRKKKKKKLNSESNEPDENGIAAAVSSPKKKTKKEKKEKVIEPPGEKPPLSLFEYFAEHIHTGKPRKAHKAFRKLSDEENQQLESEYKGKIDAYVVQLKKYLGSLSKNDAAAYVSTLGFISNVLSSPFRFLI